MSQLIGVKTRSAASAMSSVEDEEITLKDVMMVLTDIKSEVTNIKSEVTAINDKLDELIVDHNVLKGRVNSMKLRLHHVENVSGFIKNVEETYMEAIRKAEIFPMLNEMSSKRFNIIIYGHPQELVWEYPEDSEKLVRSF